MTNRRFTIAIACSALILSVATLAAYFHVSTAAPTRDEPTEPAILEGLATYTDPRYGFSFDYPDDLQIDTFDDPLGYMVLTEKPNSRLSFQIFVAPSPYSDRPDLNILRAELGDALRTEPTPLTLNGDIPAVEFGRSDRPIGDSIEVLFVRDGDLYQITTYADRADWLHAILSTLRFGSRTSL